jgi:4-diphosphocytidyl-2-C-methyl-D-erythritol kinase
MTILKAKAKVNLFFHITGKREDSYHFVDSLVVFAQDIFDEIEIIPSNISKTLINPSEFSSNLELEGNNLIDKVDRIFAKDQKYHYHLTKNIPIGAGLGGGSSDAAMVAKFLNADSAEKLLSIGADLPVCYQASAAFVNGIGEIIEPIKNFPKVYLVLVNPKKTLLTKAVFEINQNINTPKTIHPDFKDAYQLIDFLIPLTNYLTESAIKLMPEIKMILDLIMSEKGCKFSRLSGSGPTCFGVFLTKHEAIEAYKNITRSHPEYWVKHSIVG